MRRKVRSKCRVEENLVIILDHSCCLQQRGLVPSFWPTSGPTALTNLFFFPLRVLKDVAPVEMPSYIRWSVDPVSSKLRLWMICAAVYL